MIKLKPEHVGGRVLLSDGTVRFVTQVNDVHYWLTEAGLPDESQFFYRDGLDKDDPRITLLLDAPNPLDVEVPEWCDRVTLWSRTADVVLTRQYHEESRERFKGNERIRGWSPAPGQLPPREATQ